MSKHASRLARTSRQIRLAVTRRWDPTRRVDYFGTPLQVPWSSDMPYFHRHLRNYSMSIPAAAAVAAQIDPEALMVDIGANIGDTAVLMRATAPNPILCLDGEPSFFALLEANTAKIPNTRAVRAMVGPEDTNARVSLRQRNGSAHVVEAANGVPVRSLATLTSSEGIPLGLVKSDTDGFDAAILQGSLDLLARDLPLVHWEYYPELTRRFNPGGPSCLATLRDLGSIGYRAAIYWDNLGEFVDLVNLEDHGRLEELDNPVAHTIDRYYDVLVTRDRATAEKALAAWPMVTDSLHRQ